MLLNVRMFHWISDRVHDTSKKGVELFKLTSVSRDSKDNFDLGAEGKYPIPLLQTCCLPPLTKDLEMLVPNLRPYRVVCVCVCVPSGPG